MPINIKKKKGVHLTKHCSVRWCGCQGTHPRGAGLQGLSPSPPEMTMPLPHHFTTGHSFISKGVKGKTEGPSLNMKGHCSLLRKQFLSNYMSFAHFLLKQNI